MKLFKLYVQEKDIGKTNLNANTESKDLIFFCLYFGINLELDKNEPLQRT